MLQPYPATSSSRGLTRVKYKLREGEEGRERKKEERKKWINGKQENKPPE